MLWRAMKAFKTILCGDAGTFGLKRLDVFEKKYC